MPSPTNRAVIAAAGSRKTQLVIDEALAAPPDKRVLITTYTRQNCEQIMRRIREANGCIPPNVNVLGWFTFLMNQAARPYQSALTGQIDYAKSLNFKGSRSMYAPRREPLQYYFDYNSDFYRDGVAEFAFRADEATGGQVVQRLARLYDAIYIDELQDLAGYDLNFLERLFESPVRVTAVGDPRQYTYSTNQSAKNKQYRGKSMVGWFTDRSDVCTVETRTESWRCNQQICDWADALFPNLPRTTSRNEELTGHDGVFAIVREDVPAYAEQYRPVTLRWDKRANTLNLPALNMKASKGSTFDRVLIFSTQPMIKYLRTNDLKVLKAVEALYVAVTRARHSVAFVVDRRRDATYTS